MGKIKAIILTAAGITLPVLTAAGASFGEIVRSAALGAAGFSIISENSAAHAESSENERPRDPQSSSAENSSQTQAPTPADTARVISLNRSHETDDTDFSQFNEISGEIYRTSYGKYTSGGYIDLASGAQMRNCTDVAEETLKKAAEKPPAFLDEIGEISAAEPLVLVYHTHTTESFLPAGETFDVNYPTRSRDAARNMTAIGDALCERLAEKGISSVHDCTVHDMPSFTNSYARSAETVKRVLAQYPSIKIVIDLHRDAIVNSDGSLCAPICEINGKNAAQMMIISCCPRNEDEMPDYMENFKLACVLQNTAEKLFPGLMRAGLFDYRKYNQELSPGALLIEVGSHGNSFAEALYSGELMGDVIARLIYGD